MKQDVTKNGGVFTCTREDQLQSFLASGWKKVATAEKKPEDKKGAGEKGKNDNGKAGK